MLNVKSILVNEFTHGKSYNHFQFVSNLFGYFSQVNE